MIYEILDCMNAYGVENAISKEFLEKISGIGNRRMRKCIEQERGQGKLICSSTQEGGYFIPKNEIEIKKYINEQNNRILSIKSALEPFKRAIEK